MPKDRDRVVNPATAALKATKAKAVKKSKAAVAAQRTERLSHRNPDRLQRQIDELQAEQAGRTLKPRELETLARLEKEVRLIGKAREKHGERRGDGEAANREPMSESRGFKRRRDGSPVESETEDEARGIPMPRDTPPPVPARARQQHVGGEQEVETRTVPKVAKTTYESAPQIRDLRKEAVSKFMPTAVAAKLKGNKVGEGKLLEPEEMDALEEARQKTQPVQKTPEAAGQSVDLTAEEEAFERELRDVGLKIAQEGMVDEAVKEAEHNLIVEEVSKGQSRHGIEKKLRQVEIEEVEDDND